MGQTSIEWTDKTWNPIVGCSMVSPGCANCYAETMSKRLAAMARADIALAKDPGRKEAYLHVLNDKGRWNGHVEQVPAALTDPLGWRKPCRVFVNSMSDLFHPDVPFDYIDRVFAVMQLCPQHTFQILTKRPERMAEYLCGHGMALWVDVAKCQIMGTMPDQGATVDVYVGEDFEHGYLSNVQLGTSVEDQQRADERVPHLLRCPAAVRFLSCEPLLGDINLRRVGKSLRGDDIDALAAWRGTYQYKARNDSECSLGVNWSSGGNRIDWVIVGGESGPGARPMRLAWARGIRDQCVAAGVPFFFKQWGEYGPEQIGNVRATPVNSGVPMDEPSPMFRVGKHAAGRTLDGRTWDEFPKASAEK